MSSRRELLKQANSKTIQMADNHDNLTKELKRQYEIHTETPVIEEPIPKPMSYTDIKASNTVEKFNIIPAVGRPKRLEGSYHNFAARIRNDLFEFLEEESGKGKAYQSVNEYLNELIMREMVSKRRGELN